MLIIKKNLIFLFSIFTIVLYILTIYYYNENKKLKFLSYKSSKLEREWLEIIKKYQYNYTSTYCNLIYPFSRRLDILHTNIQQCKNYTNRKCKGDDLSFFIYKDGNGKILKEYIEPLFGILRNTYSICSNKTKGDILSKEYLLPSYINAIHKEIIYLDAGASTFYNGSGGSSQSYFYEFYKKYPSSKFWKWYLWEVKKVNMSEIKKEIPKDILENYNYFNKPIVVDINSDDNPLKIIKIYQKYYYIIFKLDIYTTVEIPLLNYLIKYNDIIPDEFYFEYHYNSQIMKKWWKKNIDYNCSLYCATIKFLLLRQKGIRAHPWV